MTKRIDNEDDAIGDVRLRVYTESDFTITHTNEEGTLTRTGGTFNCRLIPFEDTNGNWYLRGNINHNQWTTGSATEGNLTISGISFNTDQRWTVSGSNNSRSPVGGHVQTSDTLRWYWALVLGSGSVGGSDNRIGLTLVDIPLTAKPTWAV